ncbi:MAG: outer membrane protein assembly factor BamA [Candidatus Eisenbacteria bacterium]|nr:outer membrane protein assembly factor BamA [Candidatus Eisenbacteria bacterium]
MPRKSVAAPEAPFQSKPVFRCLLALILVGASSLLLPVLRAVAQGETRVRHIRVEGVESVDTLRVRSGIGIQTGDRYRPAAVRDGVKALYRLDLFSQVEVDADVMGDSIDLIVRVKELPRVSAVEFSGNKELDADKLREKLTGYSSRTAGPRTQIDAVAALNEMYREEGFPLAEVTASFTPGPRASDRVLSIDIREGNRVQVAAVSFEGNERIDDDKLRGELDTDQKSFWKKGHLKTSTLEADRDNIREYYQEHGYRDARVTGYDVTYADDKRTATVVFNVVEGPLYTMAAPRIEGNVILPTPLLGSLIKFKPGETYNRRKVDESAGEIGGAYADRGYLYSQVDPEESLDSTVVEVVYQIQEQEPSKVREIRITGNTRTKEKVIRRQLYLFPGSRFDRALLIRSQRELFQLGFFQDVQVDFRPIPNSFDVDLVLNVEEKAVGTASAGAGFSSQGGLTGFLELGHPNVFGNGQAVNLRMERGSRTSNFDLSFTEPWFMGSPTTLGIDIFRSNYIRDIYQVLRTGGALRFGRPVPGVAYTRMFGTYSFERTEGLGRITIDESLRKTYAADSTSYTETLNISTPDPIGIDSSTRSASGITVGLNRNSTDHPIYPQAGSISSLSWEINGGPLQGNVRFNKVLFDGRFFARDRQLLAGTKPAWMIRTQLGATAFRNGLDDLRDGYPPSDSTDLDPSIPEDRYWKVEALELFRLGGTTRGQSLRGYSDYEVVPDDNVLTRLLTTTTKVIDDGVVTRDDTTIVAVYDTFPGGRYYSVLTLERQFTLVDPLHAALFAEAGGTWNDVSDFRWDSIHKSLGFGVRMEIPLLGQVGFDYAYGFDRLNRDRTPGRGGRYDRGGWQGHLLFGRFF